jgi:hypothetical protein
VIVAVGATQLDAEAAGMAAFNHDIVDGVEADARERAGE